MRILFLGLIFILMMGLSSCKVLLVALKVDQAPITQNLPVITSHQNVEQMIELTYSDLDGDLATSCEVKDVIGELMTTTCSCDQDGLCTIGLTGTLVGTATFHFKVTANNQVSNISLGTIQVINSAAISDNLTPVSESQLIEKIYTLSYTDIEGDLATTCTISNLNNVTESTSCSCDVSGVCTVGLIGNSEATYAGASADYTVTTNGVPSNSATLGLTINQIGASINDQWIKIPANAGGMGLDAFYVMKYEARAWMKKDLGLVANEDNVIDALEVDADGLGATTTTDNWVESLDPNAEEGDDTDYFPVSIPTFQPWREISASNAALRCQSLGPHYQLISNEHWMAIARDLENQPQNWKGGAVGAGCLFRGNNGAGTEGVYITDPAGINSGINCGYNATNATNDPDFGMTRDLRAIHTLSNGQKIYDLSGNIWEWTDWDKDTPNFQTGPKKCTEDYFEFYDGTQPPGEENAAEGALCNVDLTGPSDVALNPDDYLPTVGTYTSSMGVGKFYGGPGGAAHRGGGWGNFSTSGIFAIGLDYGPEVSDKFISFRCVFVVAP